MKYIRTKDGIFELMPNIEQDYSMSFDGETLEPAYYTTKNEWVAKKDVIKQADTIEELCDEYVYHFLYNDTYSILPQEDLEPQRRDCLLYHIEKRHHDVLGAIFTDKGLIYVAKMNDKGELELL